MTDTPTTVEHHYRRLLLARSGVDRLRMGAGMFDTARAFARASIASTDPTELRINLFLRCYGADFDPATRSQIITRLRADTVALGWNASFTLDRR
jgi:hypothetical protein